MHKFNGIIPVLPATFTDNGKEIDYEAWERVTEYTLSAGVMGVTLFGAGTEFYKLSSSEKTKMQSIAKAACSASGKILLVTVSSHATSLAIEEAKRAVAEGADIINIFPPSFAAPSNEAVLDHVVQVVTAVDVPVMIQYAPDLTGRPMDLNVFTEIAEKTKSELLIKVEASPIGPSISLINKITGGKYAMAVGNAGLYMHEALERGASLIMPGVAMVEAYVEYFNTYVAGQKAKAFELYKDLLPYIVAVGQDNEAFVKYEKTVLQKKGILSNNVCRAPSRWVDEQSIQLVFQGAGLL